MLSDEGGMEGFLLPIVETMPLMWMPPFRHLEFCVWVFRLFLCYGKLRITRTFEAECEIAHVK